MCIIRLGGCNNSHHNKTVEKVPLGILKRLKECQHSLNFADWSCHSESELEESGAEERVTSV